MKIYRLADGFVFVAGESVLFVIFGIFFQNPPQINHRLAENLMILFGNDTGNIQFPGNFKQGRAAVDDLAGTFLNRRQIFLDVNDPSVLININSCYSDIVNKK